MDNHDLYKIMYISSASESMSNQALENLLNKCRSKNQHFDVTGYLIYHKGKFIQLLEGRKITVEYIYNTVALDTRHDKIVKLCAEPIEQRVFPDWKMGFKNITPEEVHHINTLHDLFGNEVHKNQIDKLNDTTRAFFNTFAKALPINDFGELTRKMRQLGSGLSA